MHVLVLFVPDFILTVGHSTGLVSASQKCEELA